MRLLLTALTALLLISTKAHAFFTIDYNEQWLRNDAYNRAMSQAKKDLEGSSSSRSSSRARAQSTAPAARKPSTQADPLWTGKLVVLRNGVEIGRSRVEFSTPTPPAGTHAYLVAAGGTPGQMPPWLRVGMLPPGAE